VKLSYQQNKIKTNGREPCSLFVRKSGESCALLSLCKPLSLRGGLFFVLLLGCVVFFVMSLGLTEGEVMLGLLSGVFVVIWNSQRSIEKMSQYEKKKPEIVDISEFVR
jgi:uncharacterized membrane protein YGL010W